jgi:hypothetical protein
MGEDDLIVAVQVLDADRGRAPVVVAFDVVLETKRRSVEVADDQRVGTDPSVVLAQVQVLEREPANGVPVEITLHGVHLLAGKR